PSFGKRAKPTSEQASRKANGATQRPVREAPLLADVSPGGLGPHRYGCDPGDLEPGRIHLEVHQLASQLVEGAMLRQPRRNRNALQRRTKHALLDAFEHERIVDPAAAALDVLEASGGVAPPGGEPMAKAAAGQVLRATVPYSSSRMAFSIASAIAGSRSVCG